MQNEKDHDQEEELLEEELKKADGGLIGQSPLADPRPSPMLQPPSFILKKF